MSNYLSRSLIRGDDRPVNITVVDTRKRPVNITGCRVYFTLNAAANPIDDSGAALPPKHTDAHTDPVNGKTTINLSHDDTNGLSPGPCWFDAQVVDAFGHVTSKLRAQIMVVADTTRIHDPA